MACDTYMFDPCPKDFEQGGHESALDRKWARKTYLNLPGGRGAVAAYWAKYLAEQARHQGQMAFVWCAFNIEHLRHMKPSPKHQPGWLVEPEDRIGYIWGGPDLVMLDGKLKPKLAEHGHLPTARAHGARQKSPAQWSVFWTNRPPATTPTASIITRTGV
jgi:hypothetical protein